MNLPRFLPTRYPISPLRRASSVCNTCIHVRYRYRDRRLLSCSCSSYSFWPRWEWSPRRLQIVDTIPRHSTIVSSNGVIVDMGTVLTRQRQSRSHIDLTLLLQFLMMMQLHGPILLLLLIPFLDHSHLSNSVCNSFQTAPESQNLSEYSTWFPREL